MIRFDSFIQSLQKAVTDASEAVNQKNLDILNIYFTDADAESSIRGSLDDALDHLNKILDSKGRPTTTTLKNAMNAFRAAKQGLSGEEDKSERPVHPRALHPVTVTVQFPENTASGIVMREVAVPLLTLVPIRMPTIEEVRFTSNFNMHVVEDDIQIEFNPVRSEGMVDNNVQNDGRLEVILKPGETPEGLTKLIEGYERALRAQIPG